MDQQFFSERDRDVPHIKNVPSTINSKQMDMDSISNSEKYEYLISDSECDSECDSVKTQNYPEDFNDHTDSTSRALGALKFLVQKYAYRFKKRLSELWKLKNSIFGK